MKFLVLLPLFAALLVTSCGEKSSPEGSDSAGASAEPSADATQETEKPLTLPLSDADVERLLKEAVDLHSLEKRDDLVYQDNTPYSGWAKNMYDSGPAEGLFRFKDGKPDGPVTAWHENGQKMEEGTYKDGKVVDGSKKYWNSKGEEVGSEDEAKK